MYRCDKGHDFALHTEARVLSYLGKKTILINFFLNRTALHYACSKGNAAIVRELLEWKAKPNIGDNQQRTPLIRVSLLTRHFLRLVHT